MKALRRREGQVLVDEIATPMLATASDVRIRVGMAGICRTDLYVAQGTLPVREPLILGHEFMGEVIEAGASATVSPGDTVTAVPLIHCRGCPGCVSGRACHHPRFLGLDLDGAFADEIVLDSQYLRKIPARLDRRKAAYAEPIAAALAVLNAPIGPEQSGVILGSSRIALLTERILVKEGFSDIVTLEKPGTHGRSGTADFVIETEADEDRLDMMLDLLRPGGVAVLKSRPARKVPFDLAVAVKKDIRLFGVSYGSFEQAIRLLESDALGLDDFLGESFALKNFEHAFAIANGGASVKTFFEIN